MEGLPPIRTAVLPGGLSRQESLGDVKTFSQIQLIVAALQSLKESEKLAAAGLRFHQRRGEELARRVGQLAPHLDALFALEGDAAEGAQRLLVAQLRHCQQLLAACRKRRLYQALSYDAIRKEIPTLSGNISRQLVVFEREVGRSARLSDTDKASLQEELRTLQELFLDIVPLLGLEDSDNIDNPAYESVRAFRAEALTVEDLASRLKEEMVLSQTDLSDFEEDVARDLALRKALSVKRNVAEDEFIASFARCLGVRAAQEGAGAGLRLSSVPQEYLCPISHTPMLDPVILVATGDTFDRPAIESLLETMEGGDRARLESRGGTPLITDNRALRVLIRDFLTKYEPWKSVPPAEWPNLVWDYDTGTPLAEGATRDIPWPLTPSPTPPGTPPRTPPATPPMSPRAGADRLTPASPPTTPLSRTLSNALRHAETEGVVTPTRPTRGAAEAEELMGLVRALMQATGASTNGGPPGEGGVGGAPDLGAGATPLHLAAASLSDQILRQALQERPGDIDSRDSAGRTPLFVATMTKRWQNVVILVQAGASCIGAGNDNLTPLHVMAAEGEPRVMAVCLETWHASRPDHLREVIDQIFTDKGTALLVASVSLGRALSRGPEERRLLMPTPNGLIVVTDTSGGGEEEAAKFRTVMSLLLTFGADPNKQLQVADDGVGMGRGLAGLTPLIAVSGPGDLEGVKLLLAAGADPNIATTHHHTTALMVSAMNNRTEIAKLLLAAGANAAAADEDGDTALHLALHKFIAEAEYAEVVAEILESPSSSVTVPNGENLQCLQLFVFALLRSPTNFTPRIFRLLREKGQELPPPFGDLFFNEGDWVSLRPNAAISSSFEGGWSGFSRGHMPRPQDIGVVVNYATGFYGVRFPGNNRILRIKPSALKYVTKFKDGEIVQVKASVSQPRFGWGSVTRGMKGVVVGIREETGQLAVKFPSIPRPWFADPAEMEKVGGPFEQGNWVRVRAGVDAPRFGWGAVRQTDVGVVQRLDTDGNLRVDYCFLPPGANLWIACPTEMELLEPKPVHLGSRVRVKSSVTAPRFGWDNVTTAHVGLVLRMYADGRLDIQFPHRLTPWFADPSEMEEVPRAS